MRAKKLALGLCLGLVLLLAACGQYTPNAQNYYTPLINEVFTSSQSGQLQWVEIYNNANNQNNQPTAVDLSSWTLASSQGQATLQGTIPTHGYLVIASDLNGFKTAFPTSKATVLDGSGALGNLDPHNDLVVLKDSTGQVIDQVGWGKPSDDAITKAGAKTNFDLNLPAPAFDNKSLGRTPEGTPGSPVPANAPGYFTIHDDVSPGSPVIPDGTKYNNSLIWGTGSDVITGIGGILLWLAFVMVALIARRFQVLAEQKTFWEFLLAAPIGIFIYDLILIIAYSTNIAKGTLNDFQKWTSFPVLFLSGIACLWVINIFRIIAKNILEAE